MTSHDLPHTYEAWLYVGTWTVEEQEFSVAADLVELTLQMEWLKLSEIIFVFHVILQALWRCHQYFYPPSHP